jgi:sulfite exporter TauE/SafE
MPALIATAFLVGLAGGVHCVAMCGGIVAALGLGAPRAGSRPASAGVPRQLAYSLGRVASYSGAGAVAGGLGGLGVDAGGGALPVQVALLVIANALIILLGLYLAGLGNAVLALERAGSVVWRAVHGLGARLSPANTRLRAVAVGVAWGFLPCGLVYSVLATALVSGGAGRGALVMAAFGLGTLPNLLAAGLAAESLRRFVRQPFARRIAGLAVVALGLLGLARIPDLTAHLTHGLHLLH